jgi:hypothetical protein
LKNYRELLGLYEEYSKECQKYEERIRGILGTEEVQVFIRPDENYALCICYYDEERDLDLNATISSDSTLKMLLAIKDRKSMLEFLKSRGVA